MQVYRETKEKIMEKYEVNQQKRLSDQQVMFQREMYGENRLPEEKEALYWQVF